MYIEYHVYTMYTAATGASAATDSHDGEPVAEVDRRSCLALGGRGLFRFRGRRRVGVAQLQARTLTAISSGTATVAATAGMAMPESFITNPISISTPNAIMPDFSTGERL